MSILNSILNILKASPFLLLLLSGFYYLRCSERQNRHGPCPSQSLVWHLRNLFQSYQLTFCHLLQFTDLYSSGHTFRKSLPTLLYQYYSSVSVSISLLAIYNLEEKAMATLNFSQRNIGFNLGEIFGPRKKPVRIAAVDSQCCSFPVLLSCIICRVQSKMKKCRALCSKSRKKVPLLCVLKYKAFSVFCHLSFDWS